MSCELWVVSGEKEKRGRVERPTFNVESKKWNTERIEYRMQEEMNVQRSTFNVQHQIKEILNTEKKNPTT